MQDKEQVSDNVSTVAVMEVAILYINNVTMYRQNKQHLSVDKTHGTVFKFISESKRFGN